jgi:hypothetical protein
MMNADKLTTDIHCYLAKLKKRFWLAKEPTYTEASFTKEYTFHLFQLIDQAIGYWFLAPDTGVQCPVTSCDAQN